MPRFAILSHDWPTPHFDLFLEVGEVLRSWRLLAEPKPGAAVPCEPMPDHRRAYLDYEGPVTGNRGSVRRVAGGTFSWVEDGPAVRVRLESPEWAGELVIESVRARFPG